MSRVEFCAWADVVRHQLKEMIIMARNPNRGRIYRRCSCGTRRVHNSGHAVQPRAPRARPVGVRGGPARSPVGGSRCAAAVPSRGAARDALHRVLDCQQAGSISMTAKPSPVPRRLARRQSRVLKPTPWPLQRLRSQRLTRLGTLRLEQLCHQHIERFIASSSPPGAARSPCAAASPPSPVPDRRGPSPRLAHNPPARQPAAPTAR